MRYRDGESIVGGSFMSSIAMALGCSATASYRQGAECRSRRWCVPRLFRQAARFVVVQSQSPAKARAQGGGGGGGGEREGGKAVGNYFRGRGACVCVFRCDANANTCPRTRTTHAHTTHPPSPPTPSPRLAQAAHLDVVAPCMQPPGAFQRRQHGLSTL